MDISEPAKQQTVFVNEKSELGTKWITDEVPYIDVSEICNKSYNLANRFQVFHEIVVSSLQNEINQTDNAEKTNKRLVYLFNKFAEKWAAYAGDFNAKNFPDHSTMIAKITELLNRILRIIDNRSLENLLLLPFNNTLGNQSTLHDARDCLNEIEHFLVFDQLYKRYNELQAELKKTKTQMQLRSTTSHCEVLKLHYEELRESLSSIESVNFK